MSINQVENTVESITSSLAQAEESIRERVSEIEDKVVEILYSDSKNKKKKQE
jgi:hypothetical protein